MSGDPIDLSHEADFSLGAMLVRPSLRTVVTNGAEELIEPRVMQVLVALARRRGEVVSRDDLVEQCWGGRVVGDDAISRPIAMIRKLGETSGFFSIETIPRIGYRLKAADAAGETPAPAAAGAGSPEEAASGPQRRRLGWVLGTAGIVLAASLAIVAAMFLGGGQAASGPVKQQRIAFFGISAPADDTAAVALAALAANDVFDTLRAMQLDTVARSETEGAPAGERLGRATELGALYAVSGTVIRKGEKLALSMQLDDVPTRTSLWSFPMEAPDADAVRLSVRSAALFTDVTGCTLAIRASLDADDIAVVSKLPAVCRDMRAGGDTEPLRELVAMAPNSAYLNVALVVNILGMLPKAPPTAVDDLKAEAIASAAKAEQIDPNNPQTQIARIAAAELQGKTMTERAPLYREGVKRAPDGRNINGWYAGFLNRTGHTKDALSYGATARRLDPLSGPKVVGLGRVYRNIGNVSAAEELFVQAHARFPSVDGWHARLTLAMMTHSDNLDEILRDPPPDATLEVRACSNDIFTNAAFANAVTRREANARISGCLAANNLAWPEAMMLHVLLGDMDAAFAVAMAASRPEGALYDPELAAFRADGRFQGVAEKFGLLDYWRDSKHPPDFCETEKTAPVCALIEAK